MVIAREKKKSNIAEYILYMWQVEDMIRACKFDIKRIEKNIISQMKLDKILHDETRIWYEDLAGKMKNEGIIEQGHLTFVKDIIHKLNSYHLSLLQVKNDIKYTEIYKWAQPNIHALKEKAKNETQDDITTAFTGLYGLLVLRLKKQVISEETHQAIQTISNMLALLSTKFKNSGITL